MTQVASAHLGESLGTDFFSVREQFTDEQWSHFIIVRRFVDEEVVPVVGPYWERAEQGLTQLPWTCRGRGYRCGYLRCLFDFSLGCAAAWSAPSPAAAPRSHDREDSHTPGSSKPFAIMKNRPRKRSPGRRSS
jgi:hypothetical protein